jgi:protein-L-isoaspartate(D-aspartate) O-methyltransferase
VAPLLDAAASGQMLVVIDRTADGWQREVRDAVHFVPLKWGHS